MVPIQLELEGFLCYKDLQKFDFSGASLWMLCGANGSGKSAVFDAIRFALFGQTRTGAQGFDALIHFQKSSARVVLTAEIAGEIVRLTRTISTKRATWQIERKVSESWAPIPETGTRDGFRDWVEKNLGFSDETFRTTIYLGQGKADRLLDAATAERTEILAQIVDLKPYQRLHETASDRARAAKNERERALLEWQNTPEIAPETAPVAREKWRQSRDELAQTRAQIEALETVLPWAALWQNLVARQNEIRRQQQNDREILENARRIQRDAARLDWLENSLPILENGAAFRAQIAASEAEIATLAAQIEDAKAQLLRAQLSEEDARQKSENARETLNQTQAQLNQTLRELNEAAPLLALCTRLQNLEGLARETEEKLAALPSDLPEKLSAARKKTEVAREAKTRLPHAQSLFDARQKIGAAQGKIAALQSQLALLRAEKARWESELAPLLNAVAQAETASRAAQNQMAQTRAQADEAQAALARFQSLGDAANCAFCGQRLSDSHRDFERNRLENELDDAEQQAQIAQENARVQSENEREAREKLKDHTKKIEVAAREIVALENAEKIEQNVLDSAREVEEKSRRNLETSGENSAALSFDPAVLQSQSEQLAQCERVAAELETHEKNWREWTRDAEKIARESQELRAQISLDPAQLQREAQEKQTRAQTLESQLEKEKAALETALAALKTAAQNREELEEKTRGLQEQLQKLGAALAGARGGLKQLERGLSDELRAYLDDDLTVHLPLWEEEKLALQKADVEGAARALEAAQMRGQELASELARLEKQLEEIPDGARAPRAELDERLAQLRLVEAARQDEEKANAREVENLELAIQSRKNRAQVLAEAEKEERHWTVLRDLLGREGLQKFLLVEAENGIIEAANEVLERISGGALFLHLVDEQTQFGGINRQAGALNFAVSQEDSDGARQTILAPYLSGSQRFRVAVALAIGMGRYALKHAGGARMETVIIDEGFGSLDKLGREEMRAELQNLGQELRRVMVVSHQDDFAQTFPNRYLITRDGLESHAILQSA